MGQDSGAPVNRVRVLRKTPQSSPSATGRYQTSGLPLGEGPRQGPSSGTRRPQSCRTSFLLFRAWSVGFCCSSHAKTARSRRHLHGAHCAEEHIHLAAAPGPAHGLRCQAAEGPARGHRTPSPHPAPLALGVPGRIAQVGEGQSPGRRDGRPQALPSRLALQPSRGRGAAAGREHRVAVPGGRRWGPCSAPAGSGLWDPGPRRRV